MEKISQCPICEGQNTAPFLRTKDFSAPQQKEEFAFSECRDCQIVFLSERPPKSEISQYYRRNYQPYEAKYNYLTELFLKWRAKQEIELFKKINKDIKDVLEIGCSWGRYLKELRDSGGFNVQGVEISKEMAQKGREQFGLDIKTGELTDFNFPYESFDLIVMNHVLEHLYNPKDTLQEIFKILRPGGILMIKTPNFTSLEKKIFGKYWIIYEAPRHLFLFSADSLKNFMEKFGFKQVKLIYEKTPNNLILSLKNRLIDKNANSKIINFFNLKNYLLLFIFLPVSFGLGLFRTSGRIVVIAKKP